MTHEIFWKGLKIRFSTNSEAISGFCIIYTTKRFHLYNCHWLFCKLHRFLNKQITKSAQYIRRQGWWILLDKRLFVIARRFRVYVSWKTCVISWEALVALTSRNFDRSHLPSRRLIRLRRTKPSTLHHTAHILYAYERRMNNERESRNTWTRLRFRSTN